MMELNVKERFDPQQALNSPWMNNQNDAFRPKLDPEVMMNLHKCHAPTRLHFEIITLFTMFLNEDEYIKSIRKTFMYMDQDNGGDISRDELEKAFMQLKENEKTCNCFMKSGDYNQKVQDILDKVDQDKNG